MVVLVHVSQCIEKLGFIPEIISNYGQIGVQLFFVASAYTLCLSSSNRGYESNRLKKYAIRRYFRIAPAYYIGIFGYFLLSVFENWIIYKEASASSQYSITNVLSNLFFVHGFYPPANNNIVPGGWSIGTEVAFYAIFPFLYKFSTNVNLETPKTVFLWLFSSLLISQIALLIIYSVSNFTLVNNFGFLYFNLANQFPVFCIGIGYYHLEMNNSIKTGWKIDLSFFIFLTGVSMFMWTLKISHLLSFIPFVSGISFIFLIKLFKDNEILNHPLIIKIGKVSYSMYLVHFIFASKLSLYLAPRLSKLTTVTSTLFILFIMSVGGSFALALLAEKIIEKPSINLGRKIIKKFFGEKKFES